VSLRRQSLINEVRDDEIVIYRKLSTVKYSSWSAVTREGECLMQRQVARDIRGSLTMVAGKSAALRITAMMTRAGIWARRVSRLSC